MNEIESCSEKSSFFYAIKNMEHLKYPIGPRVFNPEYTAKDVQTWLNEIEELPTLFGTLARTLSPVQLDTPYRPGGWTARQVIHHVPDSHMNAYIRTKLALTEDAPVIKPYMEDRWALLNDSEITPIESSLQLFELLHQKWIIVLRGMKESDLHRTYLHPEFGRGVTLAEMIHTYAWHGKHHTGHLKLIALEASDA
jgi:hypothetical protein